MNSKMYAKRTGTSGIQGQLYETKLISLIYFRMTHDDSIKQFSLATNRDDIGEFDDICFRADVKGFDKPLAVFIQAKHRENDKLLTFTSETDLAKYFSSYLKIRSTFSPSCKDMIFEGKFDDTECFFVMYTTARGEPNNKVYEGTYAEYLNELIGTGGRCTQPSYTDDDLDLLCKILIKEQITTLAKQLAKFICEESNCEMSMNNDIMLRYHVILAQNVLDVSEMQPEGHRIASFRQDFFMNSDEFIVLIKHILCLEVLKNRKTKNNEAQSLLLKFLSEPSDVTTLSELLGSVLTYRNNKLELADESMPDDLKRQLDKTNVSQSSVYGAAELAAKDYLLSLKLKVPASFGNKDLTIRGNNKKIEKRLSYLTTKILEILQQSKSDRIVTIDESLGDGFLQLNGGIASAVGNILVFDETSSLLKFTDNCESLGNLAKTLYETLSVKIENLHEYKFNVNVKNFPKLSLERGEYDASLVRDFYNKLLFYTNQANQNDVGKILREEIKNQPHYDDHDFKLRSELIFLKYHDEIQRLWMMPKEGTYLTEKSKVFEKAVANAMSAPIIGVLKYMHYIKNKVLTFNETCMNLFALHGQIIGAIIASVNCALTVAKLEQYLGTKDFIVLDLEYILQLPLKSHNTLCKELKHTAKENIFIVVCNKSDLEDTVLRLESIAKSINNKQIIVVTNKKSVDIIKELFTQHSNVFFDERIAFTDLSVKSQKNFLATYKIKLQGTDVSLDMIVDDKPLEFIDNSIFYKLINDEPVEVGNTSIYSYSKKQFYIDRRVSRIKRQENNMGDGVKNKVIKTLYDLEDDVVIITAEQGMGKSTLLTHLSIKTKELDPKVWIVRLSLYEYQRICNRSDTKVDAQNSLEYICQAALDDNTIQFKWDMGITFPFFVKKDMLEDFQYYISSKKYVHLKETPDEYYYSNANKCSVDDMSKVFQIKMFLHYYNRGKMIFLIDDFDEFDLECKEMVDECLKRKHKIWITSTYPSSNVELWFGPSYKMEYFTRIEQKTFLNALWKTMIQLKNLDTEYMMQNCEDFVIEKQNESKQYLRAYIILLEFLKEEFITAGLDFSYDEYYNRFMTKMGLCENTISCISDDNTPLLLDIIALDFWLVISLKR
ncbi:hypothetical protein PYW08_012766 [Mythimna loreyi]|uniref:Uncharacterized protein n=1 Tax=Mythimna loreyi TaxID=667449 RepID=A0ACC2Q1D9_9NEOP|nr:hypothetical protein PYW08_012766 [Mythimna loreyi]